MVRREDGGEGCREFNVILDVADQESISNLAAVHPPHVATDARRAGWARLPLIAADHAPKSRAAGTLLEKPASQRSRYRG